MNESHLYVKCIYLNCTSSCRWSRRGQRISFVRLTVFWLWSACRSKRLMHCHNESLFQFQSTAMDCKQGHFLSLPHTHTLTHRERECLKKPDGCSTPALLHTALMWPWPPGPGRWHEPIVVSTHIRTKTCEWTRTGCTIFWIVLVT